MNIIKKSLHLTIGLVLFFGLCYAQSREIAITIDDLPLIDESYEHFEQIMQALTKHKVPAIGFVIANRINNESVKQIMIFRQNGFEIGSHTYSHLNLKKVSTEEYINDIAKADKILAPFMTQPKYFRYPYLAKGQWWKKILIPRYLSENQYIIAPITIDTRDFIFNVELKNLLNQNQNASLDDIKTRYLQFVWKRTLQQENNNSGKQILLMHANLLNSYFLDDVLQQFEDHGYKFITLSDALKSS